MIRRHLEAALVESLGQFPVVLVTGARQVGKSTLVEWICRSRWKARYLTLDDRNLLDAALTDPDGFIAANGPPVAIDEVQRAPDLLRAIKLRVDRHREAGQFLLTGSANILTLRKVSESLAGRIALHELHPFSFSELLRAPRPTVSLHRLLQAKGFTSAWAGIRGSAGQGQQALLAAVLRGGYPTPALSGSASLRSRWFEAYRKTYIERDVREVQAVERLPDFSRLMLHAASRTGQVLNLADLGRDAGLPYATLRRYMNVLEQTYQVFLVAPYFTNLSRRLMKAPKLYWADTGMVSHLLDLHDPLSLQRHPRFGALIETWVAQEFQKLISVGPEPMGLYGWRTQAGQEVDFLIQKGNRFLAVEVKWGQRIDPSTLNIFRMLKRRMGDSLVGGVVLYGGREVALLAPHCVAVPHTLFFR